MDGTSSDSTLPFSPTNSTDNASSIPLLSFFTISSVAVMLGAVGEGGLPLFLTKNFLFELGAAKVLDLLLGG